MTNSQMQMPQTPDTAKIIAEDILERTRVGLIENKFETFAACFTLPHSVDTIDGRHVIHTHAEMRVTFDSILRFFAQKGVTEMSRQCLGATFQDEDTIGTTHKSRLLKGDVLIQDPYPAYSILKRTDGQWQVNFAQYSILDTPAHNKALMA